MIRDLTALIAGVLFAIGLMVSGMANPDVVLAFLDVAGSWDATLAFVMAGGLMVSVPAFVWMNRRSKPWLDTRFYLPTATAIDRRLVIGAALFGVGWGVAGYCPGPVITALGFGVWEPWIFVGSFIAGSQLTRSWSR